MFSRGSRPARSRWRSGAGSGPSVKAGGTLLTPAGLLNITAVEPIDESDITAAQARRAGFDSVAQLTASLGSRDGQSYRIRLKRAGEDPRIALRTSADCSTAWVTETQIGKRALLRTP